MTVPCDSCTAPSRDGTGFLSTLTTPHFATSSSFSGSISFSNFFHATAIHRSVAMHPPSLGSIVTLFLLVRRRLPWRGEHLEHDPRPVLSLQSWWSLAEVLEVERGHNDFGNLPILDVAGASTPYLGMALLFAPRTRGAHAVLQRTCGRRVRWETSLNVFLEVGADDDHVGPCAPTSESSASTTPRFSYLPFAADCVQVISSALVAVRRKLLRGELGNLLSGRRFVTSLSFFFCEGVLVTGLVCSFVFWLYCQPQSLEALVRRCWRHFVARLSKRL